MTNIVNTGRHGMSAEIVLLDVVAKGPEAHPEELRGFHLDAAGALEGLRDVAALDLLDVGLEVKPRIREPGGGPVARSGAPERRQGDRNDVDPVVQILPEPAFCDRLVEVPVGRRNHPDVGLKLFEPAEAAEAPFLQDPKELDLHDGAHLAYLVEEDRASFSDL